MSYARVKKHIVLTVVLAIWLPAVCYGVSVLLRYSNTASRPATPSLMWPADAPVQRQNGRATLVMFAHPQCPCSRASIGELAIIMTHFRDQLDAKVIFYIPSDAPDTWAKTDLWKSAQAIPGIQALEDRESLIAKQFGAFTSGQTLLYDAHGQLMFKGGITAARGHSGDNLGRDSITALLQNKAPSQNALPLSAPVFGCSLRSE